jgi:hypothetical protein
VNCLFLCVWNLNPIAVYWPKNNLNPMRKLFLLLIAGVGLVAVSCKKCQVCTTNTKQVVNGFEQTTTSKKEYCGSEYDNAPATGTYYQPEFDY